MDIRLSTRILYMDTVEDQGHIRYTCTVTTRT